jgi:hypothetical protein
MSRLLKALMPTHQALIEATWQNALSDLQDRVIEFQREKFPNQTLDAKLEHLRREVVELIENPRDRSEWADVFLLFLGSANKAGLSAPELIAIAHEKITINENRKWGPADEHGVHHHL